MLFYKNSNLTLTPSHVESSGIKLRKKISVLVLARDAQDASERIWGIGDENS
jgi:hypothetical protein